MPCHAIPSTASTVEDHSHADSPTLTGLESCAQAFRGPNSILRGHTNAHKVGHHRPASQVLRSPPSLSTGENRSRATSGPRLDHPATGQVIRSPPMLPTGKGQGTLKSHPLARTKGRRRPPAPSTTPSSYPGTSPQTGCPPGLPATQALRLALSGKGPRPVHPANWRRVLDVESRPSSTCDARGRSLGESPPPSARRCRGTLMGRCVLHKSSQGSG